MNSISVNGTAFVDDKGRERIFSGLNMVDKGCPKNADGETYYSTSVNDERMKALSEKGVNVIRLGFTWAGVEPECGKYSENYVKGLYDALECCRRNGVYAFLDCHQDLYGVFNTGYGDGAPAWACKNADKVKKIYLIWAEGYFFNKGVHSSFDAFWNNEEYNSRGIQDRFCDMLKYVVNYCKDNEALIGFDFLNEPFPGTPGGKVFRKIVGSGVKTVLFHPGVNKRELIKNAVSRDVMKMLSVADKKSVYHSVIDAGNELIYKFDTEKYYPFAVKAAKVIRSVTDKGVIFIENCYYSNLGIPCSTPRIEYGAGKTEENLVFSPHGYDLTVDTPLTNEASSARVDMIFGEHEKTQKRLKAPVLVGEWGGMVPGGDKYPALEHLVDKFDSNKWSNTYWHYFDDLADSRIMEILARPYPQAVAGRIKAYGFDRAADTFVLSYSGNSTVKSPTLIYLPKKPAKIYSTKAYSLKELGSGAYTLQVHAGSGECIVKVEF